LTSKPDASKVVEPEKKKEPVTEIKAPIVPPKEVVKAPEVVKPLVAATSPLTGSLSKPAEVAKGAKVVKKGDSDYDDDFE